MAEYVSANGFIQFDPIEREANGQDIIDFTIKTPGTDGILIRVTVWPELQTDAVVAAKKGDFLAVDGKLTIGEYTKDGESRKSVQISSNQIAVLLGEQKAEREVVNEPEEAASESEALF
jgi:single-stranded DNA-binding protein